MPVPTDRKPALVNTVDSPEDLAAAVERAYRLILGRPADPVGAGQYLRGLRTGELSLADVCASLAGSEEFAERLLPAERDPDGEVAASHAEADPDWVDAAELVKTVTVEELAERAEGYFRAVENPDMLLTKPLKDVSETPDLLVTFGQVLRGLRPLPGMTVLDFGAGTCWTSRFLTQLGCRVKAFDVSPTALELGRRLFDRQPVMGNQPPPEFLVFDGYRFDLPDASVDRVLSFDAFHHVPNPAEVIREMARVLRPGGIAAFSEPGPRHSIQPQSQYEMRNFGILENDVVIEDIWAWARDAGFADLRLCLFDSAPRWVDLRTFTDVVSGRADDGVFPDPARAAISDRRMFFLRRAGAEVPDSREAEGLVGELAMADVEISESGPNIVVSGDCRVRNPGPRAWLPSDAEFGPVLLGVRIHLGDRTARDVARVPLPGQGVQPGEDAAFPVRVEIPPQPEGIVAVEFDLVSEWVCWFSVNGSPVVKFPLS
jgi:SAM-dependent methyltransferase